MAQLFLLILPVICHLTCSAGAFVWRGARMVSFNILVLYFLSDRGTVCGNTIDQHGLGRAISIFMWKLIIWKMIGKHCSLKQCPQVVSKINIKNELLSDQNGYLIIPENNVVQLGLGQCKSLRTFKAFAEFYWLFFLARNEAVKWVTSNIFQITPSLLALRMRNKRMGNHNNQWVPQSLRKEWPIFWWNIFCIPTQDSSLGGKQNLEKKKFLAKFFLAINFLAKFHLG